MPIHDRVLAIAQRICAQREDGTFKPAEVVAALPDLNARSVRTHVVSRCCVNAPRNHASRWPYFERTSRGRYRICEAYLYAKESLPAKESSATAGPGAINESPSLQREVIHAVIFESEGLYVAECLEVAVVTQGTTVDETLRNIREALTLYMEGEDLALLGLVASPRLSVTLEASPAAT